MPKSSLDYSDLPERAAKILENFLPDEALVAKRIAELGEVAAREADREGDTEVLDGVSFTHHFTDVDGDKELVRYHWVECGAGEVIVFLHGIPDSWYEWHHQMASLSDDYRCISIDLKGYGQSEKKPGDYRHEAAAEELVRLLDAIGVGQFTMVTHDRGTMQGDYIAANHPDRVLRYGRGEQHLYHFHPSLAPQGELFAEAPRNGIMDDPRHLVVWAYSWLSTHEVPEDQLRRVIQEIGYPDCARAVPRYFNSSTFRQEWIDRREQLLPAWKCAVLILQGYDSKTQPREYYEGAREYIPNAKDVRVRYLHTGHFWPLEAPAEVTAAIRELLEM
ncbi:alpha/beta fold hydrolase [Amycolatopsis endophytica]|uniref:Pimeloyl-ACP methyl ester carboxylesterase n=1 Tax=Amycolatopsis endophytica TaxID=860233 RepID=A0A853B217_9PSEU|nr:alpha/beta hydrolase [Amycolatopsis endophytica]NYI88821.1 pimeloyl-ACP methyl ester carboxylesterase [Amycolatopsis endophytica]